MSKGILAQSTPTLHPVLQGALRSLDVNLKAELKRYRRYKAGEPPLAHSLTASYKNGKAPEAIAVMARSPALQNPRLPTATSTEDRNRPEVRPEAKQFHREQPGGGAGIALTSAAGSTPDEEEAIAELETEPDDYLESSAELLKSLASTADGTDGVAANSTNPENSQKSKLLTPLGIGSMLLLLMTGGTLWFVGTHPSLVRHLRDDNLKLVQSNPKQAIKTTYPKAVDLNLDSLSALPTRAGASRKPVSSPVEPQLPKNNPATPQPSVEIPAVIPIPRIPGRDAASLPYYYVVMDLGGLDRLEQIGIIPDATVQDFPQGRKIQLGVFREESRAKSLVSALADRGISAQIYNHRY